MRGKLARPRRKRKEGSEPQVVARETTRSVFTGDLGQFGLVDIAQTMMMSRKTGLLTVRSGSRIGYIYFQKGEIVYVMDDQFLQGLQAALQVFLWKEGTFEFDFAKAPPGENITVSTENLLFEVARQLDEAQCDSRKSPLRRRGGTMARSLQERHMEQIREVFHEIKKKVMPEIKGGGRIAPRGSSVETWLKRLSPKVGDSIFLIPGLKPKLKAGGQVTNLDGPKVDPQSIDRFIRTSLDRNQQNLLRAERHIELLVEVGEAAPARLQITGEGPKKMIVAHLLRRVPDLFCRLPEPPRFVEETLQLDQGLILIAGGPSTGKSRLLASLIRQRAESRGSLVFLLSRSREFIFENTTGLILQRALPKGTTELSDTLRICLGQNPDLIALDGLGGSAAVEGVFRAASTGVGIVACIEADTPKQALHVASDFLEKKKDSVSRKLVRDNFKSILFLDRDGPTGEQEGKIGVRVHHFQPRQGEQVIEQGGPGAAFSVTSVTDL